MRSNISKTIFFIILCATRTIHCQLVNDIQPIVENNYTGYNQNLLPINFFIDTALLNDHITDVDQKKAILNEFTQALTEQNATLFATYSLWNKFVRTKKSYDETLQKKYNIENPIDQLYIDFNFEKPMRIFISNNSEHQHAKQLYEADFNNTGIGFYKDNKLIGISASHQSNIIKSLAFSDDNWNVYDTNLGLYYFEPKKYSLNPHHFTKIMQPLQAYNQKTSYDWVDHIHTLLPTHILKENLVYLSGHGSDDTIHGTCKIIAGIPDHQLKRVFDYCSQYANKTTIATSSCFAYPTRLLKLLSRYQQEKKLPFRLILPSIAPNISYGFANTEIKKYHEKRICLKTENEPMPLSSLAYNLHKATDNNEICKQIDLFCYKIQHSNAKYKTPAPCMMIPSNDENGYEIISHSPFTDTRWIKKN